MMLAKALIAAGLTALTLATGAVAQAQPQATLFGSYNEVTGVVTPGLVLTPKVPEEFFATEGPIWNLDVPNRGIAVTGKVITIPYTVNGTELFIFGSSVLGQDGEARTGIGAFNFASLADSNATMPTPPSQSNGFFAGSIIGTDPAAVHESGFSPMGPRRLGPTRSIYSTSEGRRVDFGAIAMMGLERNHMAQATIEQNYFDVVTKVMSNPAISSALPADFLERAGIRALGNVYPTTAGGTLKSAGHVYVDNLGNEYFIPDEEVVIELSENVVSGTVLAKAWGDATTGTPDAFVVNECLVIFNQDPRFGADALGAAEAPIPRGLLMNQLVVGPNGQGDAIDTIGHLVGEHVLFVQEVLSEFIDPNSPIQITADRFRLRLNKGEIRFRGGVDKPAGHTFQVLLSATEGGLPIASFNLVVQPDPILGGARYSFRERNVPLQNVFWVRLQATDVTTGVVAQSSIADYDVTFFRQ